MAHPKSLSFAEIVQGRDSSVRITHDGLLYAVDLCMVVTGHNRDNAGKTLRRLSDEIFSSDKLSERNTGGSGGSKTKLVSFEHAIELIMVLPGNVAKESRTKFANIIRRYLAGDKSLIEEINANAASSSPIAQLARGGAPSAVEADSSLDGPNKKRRLDTDEAEYQMAMEERKLQISMLASEAQMKIADAQMKVLGVQKMLMESYALLCPNQVMDDRARLLFKDNLLNIASSSTTARAPLAIADAGAVNQNKPITISTLAAEMGYRFDNSQLQRIGKKVSAAYQAKYGEKPGKHEQLVGQASIMVCSYTERDRGMVEKAIVEFINE